MSSREFLVTAIHGVSVPGCSTSARPGNAMYDPFGNAFVTTDPPTAHVVATGEFDIATTSKLTAMLNRAVAQGCRDFRVDMGGVTFCDASTIGLLVSLDRRLRSDGGSLTILETSACVRRLLRILGLDSLLGELV